MNNTSSGAGALSISGLLTVAFVVLKLCKVINWPWIWVLSPFWISLGIGLIIIAVVVIVKIALK